MVLNAEGRRYYRATETADGLLTAAHYALLAEHVSELSDGSLHLASADEHVFIAADRSVYLLANAYYDGTNFNRYDTAGPAYALTLQDGGTVQFRSAAAGANPISWTTSTVVAGGDSGWLTGHTFATNWGDFTNWPVRYRKLPSGLVVLQGLAAKSAALATPETMFTLPAGFRPGVAVAATAAIYAAASAAGYAQVRVYATGVVALESGGSATWTSVGGISFLAEN